MISAEQRTRLCVSSGDDGFGAHQYVGGIRIDTECRRAAVTLLLPTLCRSWSRRTAAPSTCPPSRARAHPSPSPCRSSGEGATPGHGPCKGARRALLCCEAPLHPHGPVRYHYSRFIVLYYILLRSAAHLASCSRQGPGPRVPGGGPCCRRPRQCECRRQRCRRQRRRRGRRRCIALGLR